MNKRRFFIYLMLGLLPKLVATASPARGSEAGSAAPALHCGRALRGWNAAKADDLSFRVLSVRPSTTPATAPPMTGGIDLVAVSIENRSDRPLVSTPNQFQLADCLNDQTTALSCAPGPVAKPLANVPSMDERMTGVARANADACRTLVMLPGRTVPAHGLLQGWLAFPARPGAQPQALDVLIYDVGTHLQGWIHCPLIDQSVTQGTPATSHSPSCTVNGATPIAPAPAFS